MSLIWLPQIETLSRRNCWQERWLNFKVMENLPFSLKIFTSQAVGSGLMICISCHSILYIKLIILVIKYQNTKWEEFYGKVIPFLYYFFLWGWLEAELVKATVSKSVIFLTPKLYWKSEITNLFLIHIPSSGFSHMVIFRIQRLICHPIITKVLLTL